MERIWRLSRYQKGILVVMIVMALVFAVVYPVTISRVGYAYRDTILVPGEENGNRAYSGRLRGEKAIFTVSEDGTVLFQHGERTYGPYTAMEDPTAVPEGEEAGGGMIGVEIRKGDAILFRGGIYEGYWLFREDGTPDSFGFSYITSDGVEWDENGNIVDPVEPSALNIWEVMNGPELAHKGEGLAWFAAVFVCLLNGFAILFADELFRFGLSFRISNVDDAEPSDWEIAGRKIGWTAMTVVALVIFVIGLQ